MGVLNRQWLYMLLFLLVLVLATYLLGGSAPVEINQMR